MGGFLLYKGIHGRAAGKSSLFVMSKKITEVDIYIYMSMGHKCSSSLRMPVKTVFVLIFFSNKLDMDYPMWLSSKYDVIIVGNLNNWVVDFL